MQKHQMKVRDDSLCKAFGCDELCTDVDSIGEFTVCHAACNNIPFRNCQGCENCSARSGIPPDCKYGLEIVMMKEEKQKVDQRCST